MDFNLLRGTSAHRGVLSVAPPQCSTASHVEASFFVWFLPVMYLGKVWKFPPAVREGRSGGSGRGHMENTGLWKYCTPEQSREFLLSLRLFGETGWPDEKLLACLYAVSNHTEKHYHAAEIPKRDGTSRRLWVPERLLMMIQRYILHNILTQMPLSPYAMAYHRGGGIVANARIHTGSSRILKLDIKDFFEHILFHHIYRYAFPTIYFPPSAGTLLTHLCCLRDVLPQGAPTSAAISNLVMTPFDTYMGTWCEEMGIRYSRYCDDMTFSGDFDAGMVIRKAGGFLKAMGFELNGKKTRVVTSHRRQEVTGLVVNQKPQVTKGYRRQLRQELYYCGRYGLKSHLERVCDTRFLPYGEAGMMRYWLSLFGRVNYVLYVNPEDAAFVKEKESLLKIKPDGVGDR